MSRAKYPAPLSTACPAVEPTEALTNCTLGNTPCNGVCVDLSTDPANCGTCGNTCRVFETCEAGDCLGPPLDPGSAGGCAPGLTDCGGGACVDTASDPANCGACGIVCAAGQLCLNGVCLSSQLGCPASEPTLCGNVCSDLQTDPTNCGACGIVCQQGQGCASGACG